MISHHLLEGLAREIHDATGIEPPVDAFVLAEACGVAIRPWGRAGGMRVDDEIHYPVKARSVRQHGVIAHELGHWLLERNGQDPHDEAAADYLAGALLLPRSAFLRDLAATDWDLFALQLRHANASAQMIVCRMTQVSPATASVWDAGKLHRVYGEHDVESARRVADLALELEEPIEVGDKRAWPVLDGAWRRVLVVRRAA